jgi:hypothetical protein
MKQIYRNTVIVVGLCLLITGCASKNLSPTAAESAQTVISETADTSAAAGKDTVHAEKSAVNDNEFPVVLTEYKNYLGSINKKDINSILSAVEKYKSSVSDNKLNNDKLFDVFEEFYHDCIFNNLDLTSKGKYWSYSDEELDKYGLVRIQSFQQLYPVPVFMYETFSKYLSTGKAEFLRISYVEDSNNYFKETCIFVSTVEKYCDSLIVFENYAKKYKDNQEYKKEVESANKSAKYRVMDLLNKNTFLISYIFDNDVLTDDAQKNYLRFIDKYPDSSYKKVFKEYYDILKRNNFVYTNDAQKYLKDHDLFKEENL